jgi:4'-phosphopantetheinyl transferase
MTKTIDLWLLDSSSVELGDVEKNYKSLLSAAETKRFAGYSLARSRKQLLLSRALLRHVLAFYVAIEDYDLTSGSHGRPQLVAKSVGENRQEESLAPPEISFNISHSRERFVVAVSNAGVVGVDVEYSARQRRVDRLMTRYFSHAEQAALMALPATQRQERFYALWTLKESYIKAKGLGLALPLADFSFSLAPQAKQICISFNGSLAGESPEPWRFWRSSAAGENYALALALETQEADEVEVRAKHAPNARELNHWSDFTRLS